MSNYETQLHQLKKKLKEKLLKLEKLKENFNLILSSGFIFLF